MKHKWLIKNNNNKLIVFFNGWGMDEKVVSHLKSDKFDVLMFYDYRTFETETFDFSKYDEKYLLAWSMGVYVCNKYNEFKSFDKFIAVNGTQKPIDDEYGIPPMVYNLTVDNFNELSCSKFMKKITTNVDLKEYCSRSVQELKDELIAIRDLKVDEYLQFDKAIVSSKDRIIPTKNQINYWQTMNVEIKDVEGAHYIFDSYKLWDELI